MRYRVLFLVVVGLLICNLAYADVPKLINFQGRLTDASGKFVPDGNYTLTFKLYNDSTGGSSKWSEVQLVSVAKGLFNVVLGSVTPIPDSIFEYSNAFLGIQVAADPEMTPRQRLSTLGYAYYAKNSDKLDGLHASDFTSPVSDYGRSGVATDLYEGSNTLTSKYVNVAGPDSVYSTSGWAFKGKVSGSSGLFLRGIYGYGDNSSTGTAAGGHFETSTNGTGTHAGALGVGYGSSSASTRGTEGDAYATSTGDALGIFGWGDNTSSGNAYGGWFYGTSSGSGTHYGVYSQAGTATSSPAYGSNNYAYSSNGTAYGTYSNASNSSTGSAYGGYFTVNSSGTGSHTGLVGSGNTSSSAYADGVDGYAYTTSSGGVFGGYFLAYSSGSGTQYGVIATGQGNSSATSYGVSGYAYNSSSGIVYGGSFSTSDTGTGSHYGIRADGFGESSSSTYGAYTRANNSSSGITYGIYGQAQNTGTGSAFGGYFTTSGSSGSGWHYGIFTQGTGSSSYPTYALYGDADNNSSGDAYAGYFITSNSGTGTHYGVRSDCYGASPSTTYGSYSYSSASSYGTTIGSYGFATNNSSGMTYGGWFKTDSVGTGFEHIGVVGQGYSNNGSVLAVGSLGSGSNTSASGSSYGGYFWTNSPGTGTQYGVYSSTATSKGYAGYFSGDVRITDSLIVLGGKSAAVKVNNGEYRLLYSQESPENWFEDFGEGTLVNGRAVIQIDPLFAQTVNTTVKYHVFLTPQDEPLTLAVANRTATSFEVRGPAGSSISFSYRIVAKRKGYENLRLAKMGGPTPEEVAAEQARFRTEFEKSSANMKQEKPQARPQTIETNENEQNLKEEQTRMQQERLIRQKNREAEKQNIEKDKQPMQAAR